MLILAILDVTWWLLLGLTVTLSIPACSGCCLRCHDSIGDTLGIMVADFTICPGCHNFVFYSVTITSFTGLSGAYDLTWGFAEWTGTIGTLTFERFATQDCTGPSETVTIDIRAQVNCDFPPELFEVGIFADYDTGFNLFFAFMPRDTPTPGSFACGPNPTNPVEGGLVTVTP